LPQVAATACSQVQVQQQVAAKMAKVLARR
jgi:hypothetical protein